MREPAINYFFKPVIRRTSPIFMLVEIFLFLYILMLLFVLLSGQLGCLFR